MATGSITEGDVRDYFLKQAKAFGWHARKVNWENVNNAPDWVLMKQSTKHPTVWCELKRPGARANAAQRLEHELMRRRGQHVYLLNCYSAVDEMFDRL